MKTAHTSNEIAKQVILLAACLAGLAAPAGALDVAGQCEAAKLRISARYGFCRLKTEATAMKVGRTPDFTRCDARFADKWSSTEITAAGQCQTSGDEVALQGFISEHTSEVAAALGTPFQTLVQHWRHPAAPGPGGGWSVGQWPAASARDRLRCARPGATRSHAGVRAGDGHGGSAGNPRCVRICPSTVRSSMVASRRSRPPQLGHAKMSSANTRRSRSAQATYGGRPYAAGGASAPAATPAEAPAGGAGRSESAIY
jgi:hypothetical protein